MECADSTDSDSADKSEPKILVLQFDLNPIDVMQWLHGDGDHDSYLVI